MAGILNSKNRILDVLITPPGRAQAANGHMQFRYVTLTDGHAFYEAGTGLPTASNVASDAGDRIYFEATSRFQDTITLETDLNGVITFEDFKLQVPDSAIAGQMESKGNHLVVSGVFPTGSIINPLIGGLPDEITRGMTASYGQQYFLSTHDPFGRSDEFNTDKDTVDFSFRPQPQFDAAGIVIPDIPGAPPALIDGGDSTSLKSHFSEIWKDEKLYKHVNFMFLPPVNKLPAEVHILEILPYLMMNLDLANIPDIKTFKTSPASDKFDDYVKVLRWLIQSSVSNEDVNWKEAFSSTLSDPFIVDSSSKKPLQNIIDKNITFLDQQTDEILTAAKMVYMGNYPSFVVPDYSLVKRYKVLQSYVDMQKTIMDINLNWNKIDFTESSSDNNIIMQIFEFPENENVINKLAVIDGGTLIDNNKFGPDQRLFHVGKIYQTNQLNWENSGDVDGGGELSLTKFVNIFDIVMHDDTYDIRTKETYLGLGGDTYNLSTELLDSMVGTN